MNSKNEEAYVVFPGCSQVEYVRYANAFIFDRTWLVLAK